MSTYDINLGENGKELLNAFSSQALQNESFENDLYLNELVEKPWGHEYRIFCNQIYDAWKLKLLPNQRTSMHCHPRKDTVLLCLEGMGIISFLNSESIKIIPGKYVHIPKGMYHSTLSLDAELHLVELENPRNKLDLLRLDDKYGRKNTSYESQTKSENMCALEKVEKNTLIRSSDYENKFTYDLLSYLNVVRFLEKVNKLLFICSIDNLQHLKDDQLINRIKIYTTGEFINSTHSQDDTYLVIGNVLNR